jgi:hypothetical protein
VCIRIDEASTFAKKDVLVIYLRREVNSAAEPVVIFIDPAWLFYTTAENVFSSLIEHLNYHGSEKEYLSKI